MAFPNARAAGVAQPLPARDRTFPSESALPRTVSWRAAVLVALGGAVLITVSMGTMAAELGRLSVVVWIVAAVIGALQAALLAEVASRYSRRAGGTAQYAYRTLRRGSPTLGALSSWSYWFAWTPGIAVNLLLAGTYLNEVAWSAIDPLAFALLLGVALYAMNSFGLRISMRISALIALLAVIPLALVLVGPLVQPSSFDLDRILPLSAPAGTDTSTMAMIGLMAKWVFVAAWAAYGAEMASTLCAEMRNCACELPRTMAVSAVACLLAFGLVPVALLGIVGAERLGEDPLTAFLPAADILFGRGGTTVLGLMLAAALVLGAQAFIIGSSRTIYQISRDGHLPAWFARTNRRGVPIGSIAWDATVIALMLIVFVLFPLAYLVLRQRNDGDPEGLRLPEWWRFVAMALVAVNAFILVVGGAQWGAQVMLVGLGISLLIVPISWITRRSRAGQALAAAP